MKQSTIEEFNLTAKEAAHGLRLHQVDHIKTNIKLATEFKLLANEKSKFKLSLLNKTHSSNLSALALDNR
jgi:hypothetical protein